MSIRQRPDVEVHVIEQLVEGIKDVPRVLNDRGFDGTRLVVSALIFVAARYAVHLKRKQYGPEVDWNDAKDEIIADFKNDLEEQFAYYYGIEQ